MHLKYRFLFKLVFKVNRNDEKIITLKINICHTNFFFFILSKKINNYLFVEAKSFQKIFLFGKKKLPDKI